MRNSARVIVGLLTTVWLASYVCASELGDGFSQIRQSSTVSCLKPGNERFEPGAKAVRVLGGAVSFADVQNALSVDVSSVHSVGMYQDSINANFAREIQPSRYTRNFYYLSQVKLPAKVFTPLSLKDSEFLNYTGDLAYRSGEQFFQQICGDRFVQQQVLGENLIVALKLSLTNADDVTVLDGLVSKGPSNFSQAVRSLEGVLKKHPLEGKLTVFAYQAGGDPSELVSIFRKGQQRYYKQECSLGNLTLCRNIASDLMDYSKSSFPELVNLSEGQVMGQAAVVEQIFMSYGELLDYPEPVLPEGVANAREALGNSYKKVLDQHIFVEHLRQKIGVYFDSDYRRKLDEASANLQASLNVLTDKSNGAIRCYKRPDLCVELSARIQEQVKFVNEGLLKQLNRGYEVAANQSGSKQIDRLAPTGQDYFVATNAGSLGNLYHLEFDDDGKMKMTFIHEAKQVIGEVGLTEQSDGSYEGEVSGDSGATVTYRVTPIHNPA